MMKFVPTVIALALVGCGGPPQDQAVGELLASYSSDFRLGATVGELSRAHNWQFGTPHGGKASGRTALARHGVVTAVVFLKTMGDSVENDDRAAGYILVADTSSTLVAARLIQSHVSKFLGEGKAVGCTDPTLAPERAIGWNAGGLVVRLYTPVPNTNAGTGVRLVIGSRRFDELRLHPCT